MATHCITQLDNIEWKEDHIQTLRESRAFFGNGNAKKFIREKWVVRRLLQALQVKFIEDDIIPAEEPVDVIFHDANFQVKEILKSGRRRGDELKMKLKIAEAAQDYRELLEPYAPKSISFFDVVRQCYLFGEKLISESKYGTKECKDLDIVTYFNWHNHNIVPSVEVLNKDIGFRSLSVVSNRYCVVAYARENAPAFLRGNVGKITEYIEA